MKGKDSTSQKKKQLAYTPNERTGKRVKGTATATDN